MFIFFGLAIILILVLINYCKKLNKKDNEEQEKLSETIENLNNEYNELNNFIIQIDEVNNITQNNEENNSLYYDDTVSDEEIEKTIKSIKSDKLTTNEIIFLKFMNNKEIDISFSPRWEFQYEIKPRIELTKLLKLEYLTYSSWYDNVKSATVKELKEILKSEDLEATGNKQVLIERVLGDIDADLLERTFNKTKYILTDKGKRILEKNKRLFMSDREKAGMEFEELTDTEYTQLQVFNKLNEYKRLKHNELSFEKGYKKNDILWGIYNMQKDIYIRQKDYAMVSVVYDCMCDILDEQERYEQEIHFLICCMYFAVYEILPNDGNIKNIDCYERSIGNYCKHLNNLLIKCNKNINDFDFRYNFITNDIKRILEHYVPKIFLEFEKINKFQEKINKLLDT